MDIHNFLPQHEIRFYRKPLENGTKTRNLLLIRVVNQHFITNKKYLLFRKQPFIHTVNRLYNVFL